MLGLILFMLKKLLELIEFLFDETKKNKTKQNKTNKQLSELYGV